MTPENNRTQVVQQDLALDLYLSRLLEDMPVVEELYTAVVPVVEAKVEIIPESEQQEDAQLIEVDPVLQPVPVEQVAPAEQALALMPEWAQNEFQALFFRVDNMILATPLVELLRTIKFDREATKIPRQPSWFIGLLEEQDKKVGVLDTGQLIFGKTLGSQRNLEERPFSRLLITRDGNWGLACDEVLSIGRLEPEKVRWRTHREKRPWLIGTVIEELTAIVDVNQLVPQRKKKGKVELELIVFFNYH